MPRKLTERTWRSLLSSYLTEVWVGVEAALVTHCGATLRARVAVRLSVRDTRQVSCLTHWAQLTAGHWGNLGQRVGRFRATRFPLRALPGRVALIGDAANQPPRFGPITGVCMGGFALDAVRKNKKQKGNQYTESESLYCKQTQGVSVVRQNHMTSTDTRTQDTESESCVI